MEFKNFLRNPQFGANLALKILMFFGMIYFSAIFIALPFALYALAVKKLHVDPLVLFCRYFIYYWALDLVIRYMLQQLPTHNIKPFLAQKITKDQLVKYTVLNTFFHFFNWGNLLFIIPFAAILIVKTDLIAYKVVLFSVGILFVFYFNNFLNILLNGKNLVMLAVFGVMVVFGYLEYLGYIKLSNYSEVVFYSLYRFPWAFLVPISMTVVLAYVVYKDIFQNFYLDRGLELKKTEGKTENIEFLNRYGSLGVFLNNDIRLLKRSKAARSALFSGAAFLLYGLLFFNSAYQNDFMQLFAGIFVTGGFMFMFGQRVPAWDASYYPLMLTLNVPYKEYLRAKWALIILATLFSMVLSTAYLLISWDFYLTIIAAGLYNLGVNSYITLLAGAFNKQGIDLNSSAKSFGGGNNFNMKTMLLMIPQLLLPMAVFSLFKYFFGIYAAVASLGILGIIGFMMRNYIFNQIVKIYKTQKYSTLQGFKKA